MIFLRFIHWWWHVVGFYAKLYIFMSLILVFTLLAVWWLAITFI